MAKKNMGSWGKVNWIVARVTAVFLLVFIVLLSFFWLSSDKLTHADWVGFFADPKAALITVLALFSLVFHAWIGIWTVLTDYAKNKILQISLEVLLILLLGGCLFWGLFLLGG